MEDNAIEIKNSHALILGITFKENMSDIRNSKVIDIYNILNMNGLKIDVYDLMQTKKKLSQYLKLKWLKISKNMIQ